MRKFVGVLAVVALCASFVWAQEARTKELSRVESAQKVLTEIMGTPDKGVPQDILSKADCVAIIPSMIKVGFGFGGNYGKGVATCRLKDDHWSAPAPVRLEGGSWGLQFGGQAVDVVMLFMNDQGVQQLLSSKFKIGGEAGASAGPIGRNASADVDWKMKAPILTYSRSRGIFAGVDLSGAAVKQDTDDTLALYGRQYVPFKEILTGKVPPPAGTQQFIAQVAKDFRVAQGATIAKKEDKAEKKQAKAEEKRENAAAQTASAGGVSGTANQNLPQSDTSGNGAIASSTQTNAQSTATTTESQGKQAVASSGDVRDNIEKALRSEPNLNSQNITVTTTADTIQVSGSVPTEKDKATVRRIVQQYAGNRTIDDSKLLVK